MPTPAKGARLGGSPAHERLILANLATSLFEHGRIKTTESKAKRLRPVAERLITFAKRGDLAARRRVMRTVRDKGVVHTLFTEIAPQMAERAGGYTRITKVAPRKGDNAPMALIELVTEPVSPKQAVVREAERAAARTAPAPAVEEAPEDAVVAEEAPEDAPVVDEAPTDAPVVEAAPEDAPVAEEASEDAPSDDAPEVAPAADKATAADKKPAAGA